MLTLYSYAHPHLSSLLTRDAQYVDRNIYNGVSLFRGTRIYNINIGQALLPLPVNDIGIEQLSIVEGSTGDVDINEVLNQVVNNLSPRTLSIVKVYTEDVDRMYQHIDSELFIEPPTGVNDLYMKAMEQYGLREGLTAIPKGKVKLSKINHMIVVIVDAYDYTQASDVYLTIGLIPVFFKDFAEKFNEEELEYFKTLVRRSQVKRISNVNATNMFNAVLRTEKYIKVGDDILWNATLDSIIDTRLDRARRSLQSAGNNAQQALDNYARYKTDYFKAQDVLNNLENSKEDMRNEYKTALRLEGIVKAEASGDYIQMLYCTPMDFYNTEEAEIILNNRDENEIGVMLLKDIYLKNKYKMYVLTAAQFNLERLDSYRAASVPAASLSKQYDALFNPHIQFFQCFGDYKPDIIAAHSKGDILMFNTLMIASARSLNFRDGTVINRFIATLNQIWRDRDSDYNAVYYVDAKFLETEDGERISMRQWYDRKMSEMQEIDVEEL